MFYWKQGVFGARRHVQRVRIHLKTLGLHATEYGQFFLTTRFFVMGQEQSDVYVNVESVVSMPADELNPFVSQTRIFGELIHADARCE